ncbi:MAG: Tetracycline resistance protein, class C [Chlamydiia bacterium]|nr:Tetracycline resistance protein, class C [Chlamydiia bacterium]
MENQNESKQRSISIKEMSPLLMAIGIDLMGFALVFPVLTAMITSADSIVPNASHAYKSMLLSFGYFLYPLFMLFGASFLGDLSDNWGRKRTLSACMIGICVSFFLMTLGVYIKILSIFMIGRAFSGLMAGSQPVAQATVADLSQGTAKARNMSILAFVNSISFMIAPLIGGILSDPKVVPFFGFWTPFLFASLLGLITYFWVQFGFTESFQAKKAPIDWTRPVRVFKEAYQMKNVRLISFAFLVVQLGIALFLQYMVIFLNDKYHYSSLVMGLYYGYIGIFFSLSLLVIVPILVKRFTFEKLVMWSLLCTGLIILAAIIYQKEVFIWVMTALFGLSHNIAYAVLMTTFSNQVSQDKQGWVMGIYGSCIALGFALGGLTALLLPVFHTLGLIFLGACCYFASFILMAIFIKNHTLYGPNGPIPKKNKTE